MKFTADQARALTNRSLANMEEFLTDEITKAARDGKSNITIKLEHDDVLNHNVVVMLRDAGFICQMAKTSVYDNYDRQLDMPIQTPHKTYDSILISW